MKNEYFSVALSVGFLLLMCVIGSGQETQAPRTPYQIAVEEVESILAKSTKIPELRKNLIVRSKAANLSWERDPENSRMIFTNLWEKIGKHVGDDSFDKEAARIDLLEQIFPKDRGLATRLIESSKTKQENPSSLLDHLNGTNAEARRLAFLSYRLAEENPVLAAQVLDLGLSENTAPMLPLILNRIRENTPLLANYVAAKALERFPTQPPTTALLGLVTITGYLFPLSPSPAISLDAIESDESLRQQFMLVGYTVLKRSLVETDENLIKTQGYTTKLLTLRRIDQTILAGILSVLSSRYGTEYFVELNSLTIDLMKTVPSDFVNLLSIQFDAVKALIGKMEKSETSDAEIVSAIAKEDFFEAELLIKGIREEGKKKNWLNVLYRSKAKVQLQRGEPLLALSTARQIENTTMAIPILVDIAKLASRKKDESLSISAFQEIQNVLGKLKTGMQAKIMFAVSAETGYLMKTQSLIMLQKSVEIINALSEIRSDKISYVGENYWTDPENFLNSTAMMRAFAIFGEIDMEETLMIANKFRDNSLRMIATLATIERVLKKGPPKIMTTKVVKKS